MIGICKIALLRTKSIAFVKKSSLKNPVVQKLLSNYYDQYLEIQYIQLFLSHLISVCYKHYVNFQPIPRYRYHHDKYGQASF